MEKWYDNHSVVDVWPVKPSSTFDITKAVVGSRRGKNLGCITLVGQREYIHWLTDCRDCIEEKRAGRGLESSQTSMLALKASPRGRRSPVVLVPTTWISKSKRKADVWRNRPSVCQDVRRQRCDCLLVAFVIRPIYSSSFHARTDDFSCINLFLIIPRNKFTGTHKSLPCVCLWVLEISQRGKEPVGCVIYISLYPSLSIP